MSLPESIGGALVIYKRVPLCPACGSRMAVAGSKKRKPLLRCKNENCRQFYEATYKDPVEMVENQTISKH